MHSRIKAISKYSVIAISIAAIGIAVQAESLTWKQEDEAGKKALMTSKPNLNVAVECFGRAVDKAKAAGIKGKDLKMCLFNYGAASRDLEKYGQSEKALREVLAIEKQEKKETTWTANALVNLAEIYVAKNNLVEADKLYSQAIPIVRKTKEANDVYRAKDVYGYSDLKARRGDFVGAIALKEESLAILRKVQSGDKDLVPIVLEDLAETYNQLGMYDKAITAGNEAVVEFQKYGSKFDPGQADALNEVAIGCYMTKKYPDAQATIKKAIALDTKRFGAKSIEVARDLVTEGRCVDGLKESERLLKEAMAIYQAKEGINSIGKAIAMEILAERYRYAKKYADSENLYKEALAIRGKVPNVSDLETAKTLLMLGGVYGDDKKYADSEETFNKCYVILKNNNRLDHPYYAICLETQGDVFEQQGRLADAEKKYEDALAIYQKNYAATDYHIQDCKASLKRVTASKAGKSKQKA